MWRLLLKKKRKKKHFENALSYKTDHLKKNTQNKKLSNKENVVKNKVMAAMKIPLKPMSKMV